MRILFITDFFPPETNAAASRVYERARYWVTWGHEVTVLTSAPNFPIGKVYPGYRNRWYQSENLDGIRVVRVKTFMARNQGRWRRGLDFVSFLVVAFPVGLFQPRPDVVAATSPNFFAGVAGCLVSAFRRLPFVLEIGDLWPAFIATLGAIRQTSVLRALELIELAMYRRAARVVCVTHGFKKNLVQRGVPQEKVSVILNGVETDFFTPGEASDDLVEQFNPERNFTVGYYGTMGAAHGLESVLDAAERLPEVHFLFVGDGAGAETLREKKRAMRLDNVTLAPLQKRSLMPDLWRLCDVALVQLKDLPMLESAIPSKIFEAMSSGRPVLLAAPEGDAARLVVDENCGLHVPSGDADALVQAICRLAADETLRSQLAAGGLEASKRHSRENQAKLFLSVLGQAHAGRA